MKIEQHSQDVYAHSKPGADECDWQPLRKHINAVDEVAGGFALAFGSMYVASCVAWLHDLGKARKSFQDYLKAQNGIDVDDPDNGDHSHSGAGACFARDYYGTLGLSMAYIIAGHHAGLADWSSADGAGDGALKNRLANDRQVLNEKTVAEFAQEIKKQLPMRSQLQPPWKGFAPRDASMWIRMLYSCLVDADFLDTEAFVNSDRASQRGQGESLEELGTRFFKRMDEMQRRAPYSNVNSIRGEIYEDCVSAAENPVGLFSLTVPTGGGKTLSSTAFAFRHAAKRALKRIIYVIPYTSIIEQTADVLRKFLGDGAVLEHHCNLDPGKETQQSRLASENWDAPVIVTTAVQFFESLYANKSSRCRKLHNIAESVVILDEAQLLPPSLLAPITEAIHQLAAHYRCSIVLSTATQPALKKMKPLAGDDVREIVSEGRDLYRRLKRVEIQFPSTSDRRSWDDLAEDVSRHSQVLCIVNTRADCRELCARMPKGTIHLSASMCGEHRSRLIAHIKERLLRGDEIRVISTQLVEAGVDFDFPVVYRAMTGLASIVQAAGRCNREGRLGTPGKVCVFMPPKASPIGDLRKAEDTTIEMLAAHQDIDIDNAAVYPEYFERYYDKVQELKDNQKAFHDWLERDASAWQFQFQAAARAFKMIEDRGTVQVIVRYGESGKWIDALRAVGPRREIMRRLQRYAVSVPRSVARHLLENGGIVETQEGSGIYVQEIDSLYDNDLGLNPDWEGLSAEEMII